MAGLDEQELAEAGTDEVLKREKLESAITSYRRAIELGQRDPALVRPLSSSSSSGPGGGARPWSSTARSRRSASSPATWGGSPREIAMANRDYHQAEEIASKAVEANPDDFQARVWLAQILLRRRRNDEAEAVLRRGDRRRQGRSRSLDHPGPVHGADPPARQGRGGRPGRQGPASPPRRWPWPSAARMVGKAYEPVEPDQAKTWYGEARGWFAKAQAGAEGPGRPDGQAPPRRVPAADQPGRRRRGAAQGDPRADRRRQVARPGRLGPAQPRPGLRHRKPAADRRGPGPLRRASRAAVADADDLRVLPSSTRCRGPRRAAGRPSPTSRR